MNKTKKHSKRQKIFRLSEETLNKLEEDANVQGISETQHVENLILGKTTTEKSPAFKLITTRFGGTCIKCKNPVPIGAEVHWNKATHAIMCMDCIIDAKGDKALVKKYIENRQLKKTRNALTSECDHYADLILKYKSEIKPLEILKRIDHVANLNDDYLRNRIGGPREKESLSEVSKFFKEVKTEWEEIRVAVKTRMERLKKRSKKQYP